VAYANDHLLLRVEGHFGSTSTDRIDKWSVGLRFAIVGADVPYDKPKLQTFVDAAFGALQTFHASPNTDAGSLCFFDSTQGAIIGTDGKYNPLTQETVRKDGPTGGGAGTITQPWNTAGVLSLRTSRPRGYASNGRVYWPWCAAAVQPGTGRVVQTEVQDRLDVFKTAVNALNVAAAAYQVNTKLAVMSKVGSGLTALVTSVRADGRLDSIERRENGQAAVYSSVTIA
jgi:hypothetical protein